MLDRQTIFDTVATNLGAQGRPSRDEANCFYHARCSNNDLLKCAIGWLIPDGCYDPSMEFERVDAMLDHFAAELTDLHEFARRGNSHFLILLQQAHDTSPGTDRSLGEDLPFVIAGVEPVSGDWLADWKHQMRRIAAHYDLDTSALDAIAA